MKFAIILSSLLAFQTAFAGSGGLFKGALKVLPSQAADREIYRSAGQRVFTKEAKELRNELFKKLEKGFKASSEWEVPYYRAVFGNRNHIKKLIESGADLDHVIDFGDGKNGMGSLVYWMVRIDDQDMLQMLLDAGADPNVAANGGDTALHIAIKQGLTHFYLPLIKAGADLHIENALGETPLNLLFKNINRTGSDVTDDELKAIKLLIALGAQELSK